MNLKFVLSILLILTSCASISESANILAIFPSPSKSHVIVEMAVVKALIERGHNVTVITTLPLNDKNPQYRHILLRSQETESVFRSQVTDMSKAKGVLQSLKQFFKSMQTLYTMQANVFRNPILQDFLKEDNQFDLILHGYIFNDYYFGLGAHFKCPQIVIFINYPMPGLYRMVGNMYSWPSVPIPIVGTDLPLTFWKRLTNFLFGLFEKVCFSWMKDYFMKQYYNEFFPVDKYPSYSEMSKNISLILCNYYMSEGLINPRVPAFIEIGGIQVKDRPDPLPEDIQKYLDSSSKHGAVFFSVGTNARSTDFKPETVQMFFRVLSNLKQNVIWKWEGDEVPGNASNIIYRKWLPQDDILAHSNTKMFITHGGKGSIVESQYHGVPMLGVPFFGDQPSNVKALVKDGFGLEIDHQTVTEDELRRTVHEVLDNPVYRENVHRYAKLYKDRPMTARETAVFWVEYVIRHRGAKHMQSPLIHLNSLQAASLDVVAFLLVCVWIMWKVLKFVFVLFFRLLKTVVAQVVKKKVE